MRRKRLFILDEMIDSCRLMPVWVQYVLFSTVMGILMFAMPLLFYAFWKAIITVQVIFIILLIQKNIVYRKISMIEVAVKRMVIWVHTQKDRQEKQKRIIANLLLIGLTIIIFNKIQDVELLIINSLFCFLFFLKLIFHVPPVSVRFVDDKGDQIINIFTIIDKRARVNTDFYLESIKSVDVSINKLVVDTRANKIEVPLRFQSKQEARRLTMFLKKINKFEVISSFSVTNNRVIN